MHDHLFDALDSELEAAQKDGLAREETNLASYTDQLASGPPAPPRISTALDDEAAA